MTVWDFCGWSALESTWDHAINITKNVFSLPLHFSQASAFPKRPASSAFFSGGFPRVRLCLFTSKTGLSLGFAFQMWSCQRIPDVTILKSLDASWLELFVLVQSEFPLRVLGCWFTLQLLPGTLSNWGTLCKSFNLADQQRTALLTSQSHDEDKMSWPLQKCFAEHNVPHNAVCYSNPVFLLLFASRRMLFLIGMVKPASL